MPRCVRNEAADKLLRLVKVTSPEKHGCRIDQRHTQIDRVITLGRQVDHRSRCLSGTIRKSDQPVAARQRNQRANFVIVAEEGELRNVRGVSFRRAGSQWRRVPTWFSDQVAGDT